MIRIGLTWNVPARATPVQTRPARKKVTPMTEVALSRQKVDTAMI
jgi:hypothetical protein